ncbi:MAG: four helix bundle protein [Bacteroidetes bacterium]|nr:four helix bundle protein [Bacteroidota bacterium]
MATVTRFEDLAIWQLARTQANELFQVYTTGNFSKDFELRNQINASSGSVMDNIAEGFERSGNKEFVQFLIIAKASNGEVRSQLYRAADRNYLDHETYIRLHQQCETLSKKITAFIKYLKSSDRKGFRYE